MKKLFYFIIGYRIKVYMAKNPGAVGLMQRLYVCTAYEENKFESLVDFSNQQTLSDYEEIYFKSDRKELLGFLTTWTNQQHGYSVSKKYADKYGLDFTFTNHKF